MAKVGCATMVHRGLTHPEFPFYIQWTPSAPRSSQGSHILLHVMQRLFPLAGNLACLTWGFPADPVQISIPAPGNACSFRMKRCLGDIIYHHQTSVEPSRGLIAVRPRILVLMAHASLAYCPLPLLHPAAQTDSLVARPSAHFGK